MSECEAMNEKEFRQKCPNALFIPESSTPTIRAYGTSRHLFLFDTVDGHLALKFDRKEKKVLFECEHIKKAIK